MAVINDYVDSNLAVATGKKANALSVGAAEAHFGAVTFEIAAADSDGSIYRLFKSLDPCLIPISVEIYNDAITGGTDFDLGFYETVEAGGAVIDKDVLKDGADLSSAHASGSALDGLGSVDVADRVKRIFELCGHTLTTRKPGYDMALTANTVGSGAGTVTVIAIFVQG